MSKATFTVTVTFDPEGRANTETVLDVKDGLTGYDLGRAHANAEAAIRRAYQQQYQRHEEHDPDYATDMLAGFVNATRTPQASQETHMRITDTPPPTDD